MQIMIESTHLIEIHDGRPVRLWSGRSDDGTPCQVYVARIAFPADAPAPPDLIETRPPRGHRVDPLGLALSVGEILDQWADEMVRLPALPVCLLALGQGPLAEHLVVRTPQARRSSVEDLRALFRQALSLLEEGQSP